MYLNLNISLQIFTPVSIFIISFGDVVLTKSRIWENYQFGKVGNYVVLPIVNTLAYYFWSTILMAYMKLKKENRTSNLPIFCDSMNQQQFITKARPSFRRSMSLPDYEEIVFEQSDEKVETPPPSYNKLFFI